MCLSACCFVIFLDCRCFPADFHLGLHPAAGLSLECGASLYPEHLLCIENRCHLDPARLWGETVTTPPLMGLCGTVSNPTPHTWGAEVWGDMRVCGMGSHDCAGDVRRSSGVAPRTCPVNPFTPRCGCWRTCQSPRRVGCCLRSGA